MKTFYFFLFVLISTQQFAQSEDTNNKLSEVVVTATRTNTLGIEIASSYTVITSEQLKQFQKTSVLDVLKTVEGLSIVQQGGPGKLASVFMRGANSNHTLVLINGIDVTDPSSPGNAFDFANLQTNNIDRIEIVRGPQSTLYGSEAMAGVINIITKTGEGSPSISLNGEGGSNNYYNGSVLTAGKYDFLSYTILFSQLKSEGVSSISSKYGNTETDGFKNTFVSANFGINMLNNLSMEMNYRYNNADTDLDQAEKTGDDPNYVFDSEEHLFQTNIHTSFFRDNWKQKVYAAVVRKISHAIDDIDEARPASSSRSFTNASRIKLGWQNSLSFFKNNIITFGVEHKIETAESSYRSESEWGPYESIFPSKSVAITGLYVQDQVTLFKNFFAAAGIRLDDHERFGSKLTYRVAPAYYISSTATKLKLTYGTGFKSPSIYYLYDPFLGNPDLKPEESFGWDAGFEQYLFNSRISFGLTYFKINFESMLGFDENFRAININKALTSGVEFFIGYNNFSDLRVTMNYTYNNAVDRSPGVTKEFENLIRRPNHKASLLVNYSPVDKLNFNFTLNYTGEREDNDFASFPFKRITLSDYLLADLAVSYSIIKNLSLKMRVENLFDKYYEDVLYYGSLGRAFYAGFSFDI